MSWLSEGRKVTPTAGTVLVDTGALESNAFSATCIMSCSAAATVIFQRRNITNDATVQEQYFDLLAGTIHKFQFENMPSEVGERYRVVMATGPLAGDVQASFLF